MLVVTKFMPTRWHLGACQSHLLIRISHWTWLVTIVPLEIPSLEQEKYSWGSSWSLGIRSLVTRKVFQSTSLSAVLILRTQALLWTIATLLLLSWCLKPGLTLPLTMGERLQYAWRSNWHYSLSLSYAHIYACTHTHTHTHTCTHTHTHTHAYTHWQCRTPKEQAGNKEIGYNVAHELIHARSTIMSFKQPVVYVLLTQTLCDHT